MSNGRWVLGAPFGSSLFRSAILPLGHCNMFVRQVRCMHDMISIKVWMCIVVAVLMELDHFGLPSPMAPSWHYRREIKPSEIAAELSNHPIIQGYHLTGFRPPKRIAQTS